MRPIKFRVWDLYHLSMWTWKDMLKIPINVFFENYRTDRFILMQYTGLKDKNGKEIYEDDIVKVEGGFMQSDYITSVKYIDGAFYPLVYVKENYNSIDKYDANLFECIGNIYENPELLGENNGK